MEIVQPPGIGIMPIADMDVHQAIVSVALAAKSNAETLTKAASEGRSAVMRRETTGTSDLSDDVASPWFESVRYGRVPAESTSAVLRSSRFRKAASPASDTSTHFGSGEASAS
jgi:hypothetical protein